jgi:hypothetical protein
MSNREVFTEKFRQLLREIPDNYSLQEWQFLYRQVIFSMGMRILERFPNDVVGPDPFSGAPAPPPGPLPIRGQPDGGGSRGGGYQPGLAGLVGVILGIQPPPVTPPPGTPPPKP